MSTDDTVIETETLIEMDKHCPAYSDYNPIPT
jgi:hypothetical protein